MNNLTVMDCELCNSTGGLLLWQDEFCRVVLVEDDEHSGTCRVILNRHVREMTDLSAAERTRLMNTVFAMEAAMREHAVPDKVNLASLGNAVPHLHWHVISRWTDDRQFPKPIWAPAERVAAPRPKPDAVALADRLRRHIQS